MSIFVPAQSYPIVQKPSVSSTTQVQQNTVGQSVQVSVAQLWRPGVFADPDLDLAIKTAYDHIAGLEATSTQTPDSLIGSSISTGSVSVTGSMNAVATGLDTVSNVVAGVDNGSTPHNFTVSATPSSTVPGSFDVYVFAPTATNNNTPQLASSAVLIRWHAWGT